MTNKELDMLEKLERKATNGVWAALWRQDEDNPHAHTEFVGVPTSGNILTGCNAIEVTSRYVKKGEHEQASHDMKLIAELRNAAPALIAAAREERRLLLVVEELADDKAKLQGALERANKYGAASDAENAKLRAVVEAARKLNEGEDEWKALDAALAALDNPTYSPQTNGGANAQGEKGGA